MTLEEQMAAPQMALAATSVLGSAIVSVISSGSRRMALKIPAEKIATLGLPLFPQRRSKNHRGVVSSATISTSEEVAPVAKFRYHGKLTLRAWS